ncbi:MAG: glutamate racemase [Halanaerobiales bacterium]
MHIAFFDSGIGGLTVLKEALKIFPNEKYLYYADTDNVPYGTKKKNEVRDYIFNAVDFLLQKNIEALVIACNTATSIAIKDLRKKYNIPIIGMEPAVKPAIEKCGNKRVLVTATPLTLAEDKFENLVSKLKADNIVDSLALPGLVDFAENFTFEKSIIQDYLLEKLLPYDLDSYGTIVLGCTHFVYYKSFFKEILPANINIIDGNKGTIKHLFKTLEMYNNKNTEKTSQIKDYKLEFFISGKKSESKHLYRYIKMQ